MLFVFFVCCLTFAVCWLLFAIDVLLYVAVCFPVLRVVRCALFAVRSVSLPAPCLSPVVYRMCFVVCGFDCWLLC